jgi:hypothetical protein
MGLDVCVDPPVEDSPASGATERFGIAAGDRPVGALDEEPQGEGPQLPEMERIC